MLAHCNSYPGLVPAPDLTSDAPLASSEAIPNAVISDISTLGIDT
jgi:hypothetical protein